MYYYKVPYFNDYYYRNNNSVPFPAFVNPIYDSSRIKSYSKKDAEAIALLLGIDFNKSKFDLNEFWMGVNVELEHGKISRVTNVTDDDPILTGKIALAHLNEFPDYYQRLKVLEDEAKAYWGNR